MSWSATVWLSTTTPLRSNRNATPIIIKPFAKPKPFTLSRARASYAKWRQCCAPPSHSNSRKLTLAWKSSVLCVKPSNTKPFNCWSLPAANLTKKPCANDSINSAIISLPFWITMALMPPITWPNANCAQRSSRARSHVVTKPKKAREPGKSSLRWPPPAPNAPPVS